MFDKSYSISIFNFLANYKPAPDLNEIPKDTAMWCPEHFMSKFAATSLASRIHFTNKKFLDKLEGMLSCWKEILNHTLKTYVTDDIIFKTKKGHAYFQDVVKYDDKRLRRGPMGKSLKMEPCVDRTHP